MKHLGDITQINGSMVEPVNVIIGGSPCQDYAEERIMPMAFRKSLNSK